MIGPKGPVEHLSRNVTHRHICIVLASIFFGGGRREEGGGRREEGGGRREEGGRRKEEGGRRREEGGGRREGGREEVAYRYPPFVFNHRNPATHCPMLASCC